MLLMSRLEMLEVLLCPTNISVQTVETLCCLRLETPLGFGKPLLDTSYRRNLALDLLIEHALSSQIGMSLRQLSLQLLHALSMPPNILSCP